MAWTVTPIALVVFGSGLISTVVGLLVLRERPDPMVRPLFVMMFGVAAWAIPHAISFGFESPDPVLFWQRLTFFGTMITPPAYLVVAVRYSGHERLLSRKLYAALLVIPAITVVLVWTNPAHHLFWRSVSVAEIAGVSGLIFERGPWSWVNLGYGYLIATAGVLLFATVAVRSGRIYRRQAALMFVGGAVPLVTNAVTNLLVASMIDLTTTALSVTGITFALALFYLDLLDIRPVARDRLVEELDDGVVVIGPEGRIRDFNPTAKHVLPDAAVDVPASTALPSAVAADGCELAAEIDGRERLFRPRSTELTDERGRETGRIVYLNEVTGIREREQRISVLNRVLRHNIRNELNVASGHLEILMDGGADGDREHVTEARASVQQVVRFADKARTVERTLREASDGTIIHAPAVVEGVVEDARERFEDAAIEYRSSDADSTTEIEVVDRSLFRMALAELLENAVEHNDNDLPQVTVEVALDGDRVRIRVADDGPGIPEIERETLNARTETDLEHGSGLGLWLVAWTVSLSSGEVSFAENDPRGSVVTLSFPSGGATSS